MRRGIILLLSIMLLVTDVYAIPDEKNAFSSNNTGKVTDIFDSSYKESGIWTDGECTGFDYMPIHVSNGETASAGWNKNLDISGYVRVYFWKTVLGDEGDTNAVLTCSSNATKLSKSVNFTMGYSGWLNIGVLDAADVFFEMSLKSGGNGKIPICAYKIEKTTYEDYIFDSFMQKFQGSMVLKNNVQYAYMNGDRLYIPDAVPMIIDSRMMLPARFAAENMGCDVEWNSEDNAVTIKTDKHSIVFYIGKTEYYKDGAKNMGDCSPQIVSGRTMIPLRTLCESIGLDVLWNDCGIVIIGNGVVISNSEEFYAAAESIFNRQMEEYDE